MKISALIPTYNRRQFVPRAIQSVLSQTVPVDEILVVDDGSTDGTAEDIEQRFGNRVRVVRQANQGVSGARRRAVLEAKGDWIGFLDSDDEWTPDRNRILLQATEKVPGDVAWIFGNTQFVSDGAGYTQYEKHGLSVAERVQVFEDSLSVQYPWQFGILESSVIRRQTLMELRCFSENLRIWEDFLAAIQVACRFGFAGIPEIVTKVYRTSDLSKSSLTLAGSSLSEPSLSIDYHRAGMLAFSLAARSVRRQPWGELHAEAVRGLCRVLSEKGQGFRWLSLQQFRHGVSWKSIAFLCAAMLGGRGLDLWSRAAAMGRALRSPSPIRSEE